MTNPKHSLIGSPGRGRNLVLPAAPWIPVLLVAIGLLTQAQERKTIPVTEAATDRAAATRSHLLDGKGAAALANQLNLNSLSDSPVALMANNPDATALEFDGGRRTVELPDRFQFYLYKIEVPAGPNVLGWDVRITDVSGPKPEDLIFGLAIRRDLLPSNIFSDSPPVSGRRWPSGHQQVGQNDWTGRNLGSDGVSREGERIQQWGMGNILEPGTYYLAVTNRETRVTTGARFTMLSRGIGEGLSIPVRELNFTGGSATETDLAAREAVYFKVRVPSGMTSWRVNLTPTSGDALMMVLKDKLPSTRGAAAEYATGPNSNGKKIQKPGEEHYLLLPEPERSTLNEGIYYILVASEGQAGTNRAQIGPGSSSFTITSVGRETVNDLGTASDAGLSRPDTLKSGETKVYTFSVPLGAGAVELSLNDRVGNPTMMLRDGSLIPNPGNFNIPGVGVRDHYGVEWGAQPSYGHSNIIVIPSPVPGTYTLTIKAKTIGGEDQTGPFLPASYSLQVRTLPVKTIPMDGGISSEPALAPGAWSLHKVEVPTDVLGWDLRLIDVAGGVPRMVVRRDKPPAGFATDSWTPQTSPNWPSGNHWAASLDASKRGLSAEGVDESGRILTMAMGQPLEPGTYFIAVQNSSATNSAFSLQSRAIGVGRSIPVRDLDFSGGSATIDSIAARESAYFKVIIPTNTPSWSVTMDPALTEAMLVISTNRLASIGAGKVMQKTGGERYLLLPLNGQTNLAGGTFYLTVVSEGAGVTNANRAGNAPSSFTLRSVGVLEPAKLGLLDRTPFEEFISLAPGEIRAFRFELATNNLNFEILLDDRAGAPFAVVRQGTLIPDSSSVQGPTGPDPYGADGGQAAGNVFLSSDSLITIPAQGSNQVFTLAIKARQRAGVPLDGSFFLVIRPVIPEAITFDGSAVVTGHRPGTWRHFRTTVPAAAAGWDLRLANVTEGQPQIVVARDRSPISPVNTGWSTPWSDLVWPARAQWAADTDWTGRPNSPTGANQKGQSLVMSMGRPLIAGEYFVGIFNNGTNSSDYTLVSRGIGAGFGIPIQELNFADGTASKPDLAAREGAFYRVVVPENASSWKLRLANNSGETALAILRDVLPNSGAASSYFVVNRPSAGRRVQIEGNEQFVLLKPSGIGTNSIAGTYYLAVIAEGQNTTNIQRIGTGTSDYVLQSQGPSTPVDLGALGNDDLLRGGDVEGGESRFYQFTAPEGLASIEMRLEIQSGSPTIAVLQGDRMPNPGAAGTGIVLESYGAEFGAPPDVVGTPVVTVSSPKAGLYTLAVFARKLNTVFVPSIYTLRIRKTAAAELTFDNGSIATSSQAPLTWNFFRVDVPTNALGWDLRLDQVTAGKPRIVVRRETAPNSLLTGPWTAPGDKFAWPTNNQWAVAGDWTRRANSADGTQLEDGRVFAVGKGRPLEPGGYVVGVYNENAGTNATYTLRSRGIGEGFAVPVTDLEFADGTASVTNLPARDAAYYRILVPTNAPSWKFSIETTAGEVMWVGLRTNLPNVESVLGTQFGVGRSGQKLGNEHFVLLPTTNAYIPGGAYYLAVVSEGEGITNATRIGAGNASFTIKSHGPVPVTPLPPLENQTLTIQDSAQGGEVRLFQVQVPEGTPSLEIRLTDRVGNPAMTVVKGSLPPEPGIAVQSFALETYGNEGGQRPEFASTNLVTIPNPIPGPYTIAVKARAGATNVPNATFTLAVSRTPVHLLAADSSLASGELPATSSRVLQDNERGYYRVSIPASFADSGITGWKLNLSQTSGKAEVRVRKDALPLDGTSSMAFSINAALIVPPFLTPGTWYIEVKATGPTAFTLTSTLATPRLPAWNLPSSFAAGDFGDSGIDAAGAPLPSDQGVDLEGGDYHLYVVNVPTNNSGLLRTQLDALRGAPELFVRSDYPPTLAHNTNGASGTIVERSVTGLGSKIAHWTPLSGKTESALKPGRWYLAVRSAAGASRYRLRLSTGLPRDLALGDGSANNIEIAAGDWSFFKVAVPVNAPNSWRVSFSEVSGDVSLYIRDTVPPGNGTSGNPDVRDWNTDAKNFGPYPFFTQPGIQTLTTPPLRPGQVYYLGFRGNVRSFINVTSSVDAAAPLEAAPIDFLTGTVTNFVAPNTQLMYRITVPPDGVRWTHRSIHPAAIQYSIEQGTLPLKNATDEFRSLTPNSTNQQSLLIGWPWVPGQHYFLVVTNTATTSQPFSFTMTGRTGTDDDMDGDGLSDRREVFYFNGLAELPGADKDGDGISNGVELNEGTNPNDRSSLRPRLALVQTFGKIFPDPAGQVLTTNLVYAQSTAVSLTPVADPGYFFANWTGNAQGGDNPLRVVLTSNVVIGANFRLTGDDFASRLELAGATASYTLVNTAASKEAGEPNHATNPGGKSVWWKWIAPTNGPVTVTVIGDPLRPLIAVYTGTSVNSLAPVASAINRPVLFTAAMGTEYQIAVDGANAATGTIRLSLVLQTEAETIVESAATVNGPYAKDTTAAVDAGARRATIPLQQNSDRFYRLKAGTAYELKAAVQGATLMLSW